MAHSGVSYLGAETELPRDFKFIKNAVGAMVIKACLYLLHRHSHSLKRVGFSRICKNVGEAMRFPPVGELVINASNESKSLELGDLESLFQYWSKMSRGVRNIVHNVSFEDYKKIFSGLEGENEIKEDTTILQKVHILKKEREVDRENRRKSIKTKYKTEKFGTKVKDFKRRKPKWLLQEGQTVQNVQEAALNDVLNEAGNNALRKDVWTCIYNALMENDERIAKLIIQNTDVNVEARDWSVFYDDYGFKYEPPECWLSEPKQR